MSVLQVEMLYKKMTLKSGGFQIFFLAKIVANVPSFNKPFTVHGHTVGHQIQTRRTLRGFNKINIIY